MQAFLSDRAGAARRHGGELDNTLITILEEIIFDAENIIDEFLLFQGRYRRQQWHHVFRFFKSLGARHRLGTELKRVKSRVDNTVTGISLNAATSSSHSGTRRRNEYFPTEEAELVGVGTRREELLGLLVRGGDSRRQAVAIKGMGGLGKSTLADLAYSDAEVKQHFDCRVWITVSKDFRRDVALREIITQLSISAGSLEGNLLAKAIQRYLLDKRYLIVLDDVWGTDSWNYIQSVFPQNSNYSRLLLTTRVAVVANACVQTCGGSVYELPTLSQDDSWALFHRKAFSGSSCPENLTEISREILERCQGLPLAISMAGGVLATRDQTVDQFRRVLQSLGNEVDSIFSLGFDDLTGSLKACMLYLTVFPNKQDIPKSRLIRLWIAESFVVKEAGWSLEQSGEDYFNELLNRSLIQVSEKHSDGRVKTCRVHDLIHDIILRKANGEHFTAIVSHGEEEDFPARVHRLSAHKTAQNVPAEHDFSKLRSLLVFHFAKNDAAEFVSMFLKGLRLLQVLDLSHSLVDRFPERITKLYNLKYPSLRGPEVKLIPRSIDRLYNLQTLDMKDTGVEVLPAEILKISTIRHIHVYRSICHGPSEVFAQIKGFKVLRGIGVLRSLQSLCHFEAIEGSSEILESIGELNQLRKLGVLMLTREDGHALCSAINKLSRLSTLELQSRESKDILDLRRLSTISENLQRLRLAGRLERLPDCMSQLAGLRSLVLRFSGLNDDPAASLCNLTSLVELRLYKAYDGEELRFGAKCFPMLRVLDVRNSSRLKKVKFEEEACPSLEKVVFEQCKMLKEMPFGIERLSKLQQLQLIDMDNKLVIRIRQKDQNDQDYLKIRHIPSVEISSRRKKDGATENLYQYMGRVIEESDIIVNSRFEDGLNNWSGRGCEIFQSDCMGYGGYITPFSGASFACTRNRERDWNGIDQDITGKVVQNVVYEVTAVVRVFSENNVTESDVIATLYVQTTDKNKDYIEVAKVRATDGEWKKLQGKFQLEVNPIEVVIYVEGPPPGTDILLDSLVINRVQNAPSTRPIIENRGFGVNIIENSDLHDGVEGWFGLGNCSVKARIESSARFISSRDRNEIWMGPAHMITDKLKVFLTYQISAQVKIDDFSQGSQKVCINLEVVNDDEGVEKISWVEIGDIEFEENTGIDGDGWHEIVGSFRLEKQPTRVMIYVFGPSKGIELKVAELKVFSVDRIARFSHLNQKIDKVRKRDVVLTFSGVNLSNSALKSVKVRQTHNSFPFGSYLYRSNLDKKELVDFFLKNFNWAVFVNELKWHHTEPQQGNFNYKEADEMFEFCQRNNIKVRGHCIFWEEDDPEWVSSLSKKELLKAVENRLESFIKHCRGKVEHYDVINEMLERSFYKGKLGDTVGAEMFIQAKKLDPHPRLFLNEDNISEYIANFNHLSSQGAPIEGIGIQVRNRSPIGSVVCSALDKLGRLGIPIWVTELQVYSVNEHVRADDLEVMIREVFAHPCVEGIILQEFWETFERDRKKNISHLVNAEGEVNEAGMRFLDLKKEFLTSKDGNVDNDGQFEFRGFHGNYRVEVETDSEMFTSKFVVEKGDGLQLIDI